MGHMKKGRSDSRGLLKNAHLRRSPHPRPVRSKGLVFRKRYLILRDPISEIQPGYYLTGQAVAAYRQVRVWPTHQLVGVARSRSLFVATPLSGFREPPQAGFREAQLACACLREAASAKAGAFLSSLEKSHFFSGLDFDRRTTRCNGGSGC